MTAPPAFVVLWVWVDADFHAINASNSLRVREDCKPSFESFLKVSWRIMFTDMVLVSI